MVDTDQARLVALETKVAELLRRPTLEQLERRIAALESRVAMHFVGRWRAGETYEAGDITQHHNALWHCNAMTGSEPGTNGQWTMLHKSRKSHSSGSWYSARE